MPLITFPNVPQVLGVPQVLRQLGGPQVSQITDQFPGADQLLNSIPGVTDFLSTTPNATIQHLFDSVPGVSSVMTALPGFSQILKLPSFDNLISGSGLSILTGDDPGIGDSSSDPKWGVYDVSGAPIVQADSFVSFEYSKDYSISKNPVAPNAFGSYNKVERPYEARVSFAKGGSEADRSTFLNTLDLVEASINLYSIVTPEVTYINANIISVTYERRAQKGVTLIVAELHIEQVRTSATTGFSNTVSPVSSAPVNGGTVQPKSLTAGQSGLLQDSFG